eukprot:754667-Hanusia_phi.AAC.3
MLQVLSQYSELHPEDFDDLDNIQDVRFDCSFSTFLPAVDHQGSGRGAAESMKLQLQQKVDATKVAAVFETHLPPDGGD